MLSVSVSSTTPLEAATSTLISSKWPATEDSVSLFLWGVSILYSVSSVAPTGDADYVL